MPDALQMEVDFQGRSTLRAALAALERLRGEEAKTLVASLRTQLSALTRLEALSQTSRGEAGVSQGLFDMYEWVTREELRANSATGAWAAAEADALLAAPSDQRHSDGLRLTLFEALIEGGVTLEPRWDVLMPLGFASISGGCGDFVQTPRTLAIVAAIAPERRGAALVSAICRQNRPRDYVSRGLSVLQIVGDSREVTKLILEHLELPGAMTPFRAKKALRELARSYPLAASMMNDFKKAKRKAARG